MKKIAASVGLLALGASALHAAESSTLNTMQNTKAWSVQATLRGFYDDNIAATPDVLGVSSPTESTGFQISPSVDYGFAGEQTSFNLGYSFTARYFDKQAPGRLDKSDYTHTFDADLSHAFSPRVDIAASESFVIGQEPDLLRDPAPTQPIEGDNIRNFASVDLGVDVTQLLAFSVGYNNSLYDYDQEGPNSTQFVASPGNTNSIVNFPSNSGLFDRVEHGLRLDSRWKWSPQTTGIIGYTHAQTAYTSDEPIRGTLPVGGATNVVGSAAEFSDSRDSRSHIFYVGAEHVVSSTLSGMLNVGAQYTDYINSTTVGSQWNPYVQGSIRYQYQATTLVDLGVRHSRSAANDAGGAGSLVLDTATTVVYGSIKHELMSKFFVTANATLQNATYNAPGNAAFDDKSYLFYQLGLDLSYQFNPNFSGHIGYNYDQMDSDLLNRDYERNRVYMGVTAGF